jgi:hypothetical protein
MVPCVFINLGLLMYVFSNIIATRLTQRVRLVELELLTLKGTLSWSHYFERFTVATMIWLTWWNICVANDHGYVPLVVNTSRSFPHSWLIIGFVTRLTRRVSLVEQELPTLPEHLSSSTVFSGVRVTRSLVLCVCFVGRCLFFCTFYFGHCVICPSIYGFWLPLWWLQFLLIVLIRLDLGFIKPFKYYPLNTLF